MTKTEEQICETLIGMMEEKPFPKIKVTELAQHSGVSRSTFYTYYDSIYDVLQAIEDDFLSHIVDESKVGLTNDDAVIAENFSYIRDNLRTFQTIIGPNGDPSFEAKLGNRSKRILSNIAGEARSSLTDTQLAIVNEFARAGKMQVFQWWGKNKNDVSVSEIVDMLDRLAEAVHDVVTGQ